MVTINCPVSLTNVKEWTVFKLDDMSGQIKAQILIQNNPTINYAELVLQPHTLDYGLYKCVFKFTLLDVNLTSLVYTYIKVIPSGLVLSSLKLSQPMYGGLIQIKRGQNQLIEFDPLLFTYDLDGLAIISSLQFKYACQLILSNVPQGLPLVPNTNVTLYLNDFKANLSLSQLNSCFNSTGI